MRIVSLRPTPFLRASVFLLGDLVIWIAALWSAFLIRFDGAVPANYAADIPALLTILIPVKFAWYAAYRLYHLTWRAVSLNDFISIVKANTLSFATVSAVIFLLSHLPPLEAAPRSVLLLDFVLATCGVTFFRAARRGWLLQREMQRSRRRTSADIRLIIVGAGAAGSRLAQTVEESGHDGYRLMGFIDDDPAKHGAYVRSVRVFGGRPILERVVREQQVDEVLIAIPSVPPLRLREIVDDVRRAGVRRIKILPGAHEWLAGRQTLKDVREVKPQDLLGRPAVRIQYDALKTYFTGRRVMVTGAAGSIGSELVRQLFRFPIAQVVAVDISESGLFELEQELQLDRPDVPVQLAVSDVRDELKMEWLMQQTRPQVVFHAAAYKHVPMMERESDAAVKTNIFGTLTVAEAARRHGAETFVFVSTDKAVNPASVLGASKRIGEMIGQALGRRGQTRFLSVRFGNVLGSRGSLIPVLQEQIHKGGPVTITHPDMVRYFMTVQEAVLLVLQTPLVATSGTVFMLDMGRPVRIVDLVRELIKFSGLEEDRDIPIVYTGVRAGEKIEEKLVAADEQFAPTVFDGILEVRSARSVEEVTLRLALRELESMVRVMDAQGIRALLNHLAASHAAAPEPSSVPQHEVPVPGAD